MKPPNACPRESEWPRGQAPKLKQGYGLVRRREAVGSGCGVVKSRRAGATPARWEVGLFDHQESEPPPDLRRCSDSDESQPHHQGPNLSRQEYTLVVQTCKRFFQRSPKISNVRNRKRIGRARSSPAVKNSPRRAAMARRFAAPTFNGRLTSSRPGAPYHIAHRIGPSANHSLAPTPPT